MFSKISMGKGMERNWKKVRKNEGEEKGVTREERNKNVEKLWEGMENDRVEAHLLNNGLEMG